MWLASRCRAIRGLRPPVIQKSHFVGATAHSPLWQTSRDFGGAGAEDKVAVGVVGRDGGGASIAITIGRQMDLSCNLRNPAKLPSGLKLKCCKGALNVRMPVRCHVPRSAACKAGDVLVVLVDVPPSWYTVKARKTKRILPLQSVAVTCASHTPSKDALCCAESSCCAKSEAGVRIRAARAIVETSDFRVIFFIFVVFLMFLVVVLSFLLLC